MDALDRLARRADALLLALAGAFVAGFFLCVVAQVVCRYFLGESLVWSDELARYLFVWASLLAAGGSVGRGDHFSIPLLADAVGPRLRLSLDILVVIAGLVFGVLLAIHGWRWSARFLPATSPVLEVSQGLVYGIVPFLGVYMTFRLAVALLLLLAHGVREKQV